MKEFKAGVGISDITPPVGTLLYGYPRDRVSTRVLDNLYAKAVALSNGDDTVIMLSLDVCQIKIAEFEIIKEKIAKECNIKKENITCSSVHTHSGPITCTSAGWGVANVDFLDNTLIPCSVKAAKEAYDNLQPAVMGWGTVDCLAGINRREIKDGKVILGQNPSGPYDPTMTGIVFKTPNGENIATIIHFAMHPTCSGSNFSITRDWPGYMVDRIEEVTGASCMYINGAQGDIGPRLSNGQTTGDESSAKEAGTIAADSAEKLVNSITEFKVPELNLASGKIPLPTVPVPSFEQVLNDMEKMGDPEKLVDLDVKIYDTLKRIKAIYEKGESFPPDIVLSQTVIALDSLALVPFPFESFCEIALSLNEKSPYERTLLLGLTNGTLSYLPTEEQLPYGGYEVGSFHCSSIPPFIDSMDKYIVEENVKLLNTLHNN